MRRMRSFEFFISNERRLFCRFVSGVLYGSAYVKTDDPFCPGLLAKLSGNHWLKCKQEIDRKCKQDLTCDARDTFLAQNDGKVRNMG